MRGKWFAAAGLLAALVWMLIRGNTALKVTELTAADARLPDAFDGFRIAQVSDLHNAEFGRGNGRLLQALRDCGPDMIAVTGDFVDSDRTDLTVALGFAQEAVKIAPVYYVSGNHEALIGSRYALLRDGLTAAGAVVLEDCSIRIARGEEEITLMGASDIGFVARETSFEASVNHLVSVLDGMRASSSGYAVLLSHRPELLEYYSGRCELALCGHAHGGQFRLPFAGGLIAPGQGLFPEYDAGLYESGGTSMVVSRGLGNSVVPLRINNRPEIVVVTLRKISS